ncbi:hypothetical protein [Dysgonomonas sp. 521]|uniref:hypothetical protein n=1 Tax=Dysgonomonas sp. 521 TaxID=2302932 RepID=UPI0013D3E785|nr:hypothetical protein [Dysgonomonas sp. 521]
MDYFLSARNHRLYALLLSEAPKVSKKTTYILFMRIRGLKQFNSCLKGRIFITVCKRSVAYGARGNYTPCPKRQDTQFVLSFRQLVLLILFPQVDDPRL